MKNMLEELKKLDIEDKIEVPVDFRKKVVDRINKDKVRPFNKYIISSLSVAAVAIIACVVLISNDKIKVSDFIGTQRDKNMQATYEANYDNAFNDVEKLNSINELAETENSIETTKKQGMTNDMLTFSGSMVANEDTSIENMASDEEFYLEIVDILKTNNIEAEYIDGQVKAKGNIEDIKMALTYYEDVVEITKDGEYIIIK